MRSITRYFVVLLITSQILSMCSGFYIGSTYPAKLLLRPDRFNLLMLQYPRKEQGSRASFSVNLNLASNTEKKDGFLGMCLRKGVSAVINLSEILVSFLLEIVINLCYFTQNLVDKTGDCTQPEESKKMPHNLSNNQHEKFKLMTKKKVGKIFSDTDKVLISDNRSIAADLVTKSVRNDKEEIESGVTLRIADISDTDLILLFIKELARYEEMEDSVIATSSTLQESLFPTNPTKKASAEVIILEVDGVPAGFTLYFYNFSTFLGKYGMYIEDLYVRSEYRGKGYGTKILKNICQRAVEKNCGRVEWWCLDWNEKTIKFYLGLGAEAMTDWTVYRLSEEKIKEISSSV